MPSIGCCRATASRPRFELAEIIRQHGEALRAQHVVRPEQGRVLRALAACRTAALGGHLDHCLDCGFEQPAYNSCRNRHCPKCQALDQARWLAGRMQTLLPIPYFHVVFTLPGELARIVRRNPRRLFNRLFSAASETLLTLGRDPHRLGAQIGFTMVLHTWTRDLRFHPHIHAIVTGGGLSLDGQRWVPVSNPRYLLPVLVVSRLFRGKMLAGVRQEQQRQPLEVPPELGSCGRFETLLDELSKIRWVTYAKPPFAGPEQVLRYLARYTHRVALANSRLLEVTADRVILRTRGSHTVTLTPVELLRRFLLHVLPFRFVKIRHYGLLASSHLHTQLATAQRLLSEPPGTQPSDPDTAPPNDPEASTSADPSHRSEPTPAPWQALLLALTGIDPTCCPACGSRAWVRSSLPQASRAPPKSHAA